jgi:D-3-phosphoglycerate dehydrogenase
VKYVVVVADAMDESGLSELTSRANFEVITTAGDAERLAAELPRAHALLVRSATQVTSLLMGIAPNLKVIGRAGIGVDNIDVDAATRRGIAVLNAPGANTVSAAEHTFALLLSLVRRIPWAVEDMRRGGWNRSKFSGTELRGKTMGIVGLGRIGVHVAGLARAFGMEIVGHDPYLAESRARQLGVGLQSIDDLVRHADVLTFHAPLTDATRHILNRQRIARLKPSAIVINTARGPLIDVAALVDALNEGRVAGAAMDVFDFEPLDESSPLRTTERLILTPHLAASTSEAQERVALEIARATRRALETGEVGGAVNVPGVSNEMLARARVPMELARRLGRLACYAAGPTAPSSVEVSFGGEHDEVARPVMLAAVEGVLQAMAIGRVSLINATVMAEERNIALSRRINRSLAGASMAIEVKLQVGDRSVAVVGVPAEGHPGRVIRIDEFMVDLPAEGCIVILRNKDVPGVVGRVGTVLGESGINIGFYHQSRSNASGVALAAIAVDQKPTPQVLDRLREFPDVHDVHCASLETSAAS